MLPRGTVFTCMFSMTKEVSPWYDNDYEIRNYCVMHKPSTTTKTRKQGSDCCYLMGLAQTQELDELLFFKLS